MISHLRITNYALIRDIELSPQQGFNIITGETGAGKSIILGALGLLRGNRADAKAMGNPGLKSVVEADFSLTEDTRRQLKPLLESADIDDAGDQCIIRREILPSGRSRAFVNDTPVKLTDLGPIADRLVDIHSQHKNLLLADSDFQLRVIDSIARNSESIATYRKIYEEYRALIHEYSDTRQEIERTRADADYIKYQLDELTNLNPVEGEDVELQERRRSLAASETEARALSQAGEILAWGDVNVSDLLDRALEALQEGAAESRQLNDLAERLNSAMTEVNDIADTITAAAAKVGDSPAMIEEIDSRLQRLNTLMTRHKASSAGKLIEIRNSLARRLTALTDADATLADMEHRARALKRRALEAAAVITEGRKRAATLLVEKLLEKARPLGLSNLTAEIAVTTGRLNPNGVDTVDFRFSFNKNQPLQSIGATASGGEISRVMLALKSILAGSVNLPTIIFDEIDTGVSGDVAARMGDMMASLARDMQVITITHLPAVAAYGKAHFKVFKRDGDDSTETYITPLDHEERRHELAAMLSGKSNDEAALAAADSMLNHTKNDI
ncbi:MAG: DNA repair protein RecN [Odoribacter sp.]|nr:DNA repair protein RecN [Odoribacter sp.]